MISLMMLSGGIDSTYVLARLLRETDDEILVHHVHFLNNSNRHIPEAAACKKIVD
jgi:7-cyano-7-deazaguanine synthase in queuosine biosynthesis